MAHVQERRTSTGRIRYRVVFRDDTRKERVLTFEDRNTAEHWSNVLNTIGVAAGLELFSASFDADASTPTVRAALTAHIDGLTGITAGTRGDYHLHAKRDIYPTLGDLPVTALTRATIAGWINALSARGLAPKTIRNRHALISALCTRLVIDKVIDSHPSRGIRMPEGIAKEMICLTPKEFAVVHKELPAYWRPFFLFLVSTALRLGEATALVVDDVQFEDDRVRIRVWRAWKHGRGTPVLGPPKSKAGSRTIEIATDSPAAAVLRKAVEGKTGRDLMFTAPRGGMIRQSDLHGDVWGLAMTRLREAGVTRIPRMHDLRHTGISWMLAAGVPPLDVAYTAGHEDVTMTLNRYGHAMPSNRHLAAAATASALSSAGLGDPDDKPAVL